ncbi:MAG: LytTR family DNA-binding domain-containing protein [Bacteroidales bacterium]|nr:LytTR family DNA-binding domain-containing protein [Bacteroidales bacterium]MDD4209216.1 LytTR family DNA-binding domain-containing protein [Bacteroidales bacterium]
MSNLIRSKLEYWKYLIISFTIALTYAFSLGFVFSSPLFFILTDAFLFGLLFFCQGLVIWNVLRYGNLDNRYKPIQIIFKIIFGIIFIGGILGIESLIFYLVVNPYFAIFIQTLLIRIYIICLLYIFFIFYYNSINQEKISPILSETTTNNFSSKKDVLERISVRNGQKIIIITIDEIIYLQAEGDYVAIVTSRGRWLKEQTMKYFEEHLPEDMFIRIHRSYIVALRAISRIEKSEQHQSVILITKERIRISITGYKILKKKLNL